MNPKKIKKIIYSILKELTDGNSIPSAENYGISNEQFMQIVELMLNEGYLNSERVSIDILDNVEIEKSIDTITMKGIKFLEDNSKWSKFYKGIKEIRNFIIK